MFFVVFKWLLLLVFDIVIFIIIIIIKYVEEMKLYGN